MDKKKDPKKTEQIDLAQFKQLIGDAERADLSLDEILAEYGAGPQPPKAPGPARSKGPGKVVAFPGTGPLPPIPPQGPEQEEEEEPPGGDEPVRSAASPRKGSGAPKTVPFPTRKKESPLSSFFQGLGRKADDYADRMFEEDENTDPEEVRRLEKLIPGTDREEEPPEPPRPRRERRPEPPPPDLPPKE